MLRSINARGIAQARLAPVGAASVRRLSSVPRPSAVALGKRPALPPRSAVFGMMSARHISFFGGKEGADAAAASTPASPAVAPLVQDAAPAAASTSAPSTSASISAAAEPVLSTPDVPLATPVPASDIPSSPVETALPPAQHLTSTAPDHHFHSDPTPLLPQAGADAATPTLQDLITNSGLPLDQVLNSPEAVHAAVKVSDLSLMGLNHGMLNVAGWFRDALVGLHNITDLPWWATIALFTLGLRACLFPVVVKNMRHNIRLQAVSPQMQALMKRITAAKEAGDNNAMTVASTNLQKLFKEHNVSPFGPLIMPLFQIPVFLGMFYALKKLAAAPLPQLKEGGFSWVTDLTMSDPYFILPITSLLLQLTVFKVGVDGTGPNGAQSARTMAHFRNAMIMASPLILYTVAQFPAAVLFYWTTTNAYTLLQAFMLRQPWVRKLLHIKTAPQVEPPPDAEPIDTNPSLKDSLRAGYDWHKGNMRKFEDAKAQAAAAQAAAARERRTSRPVGTAMMYEKVNEPARASVTAAAAEATGAGAAEGIKAQSATVETTPLSRDEAKRRRVEAARAKRAGRE